MATKHDALAKWMQQTDGQQMAVVQKLYAAGNKNPDVFDMIRRGELRIELVDAVVKLVDQNGRAIPPAKFGHEIVDANRDFNHVVPTLDLKVIYEAYRDIMPSGLEIVTLQQFVDDYVAIMREMGEDRQVANLSKGTCLPVILPKCAIGDYGETLERIFLKLVENGYKRAFPEREFCNYRSGTLAGQVKVVDGTRHDQIISRMQKESFVAVYAVPFQGFSIPADRAMMAHLPKHWCLSGAIDTSVAFAMHPEILARNCDTPVADCAAVLWQGPESSLLLFPNDDCLGFDNRDLDADYDYSAGVLVPRQD